MLTNWGYTAKLGQGVEKLPAFMTVAEFKVATGGVMSSTDNQISWALDAVSQAIRDWCGWHVSPVIDCTYTGDGEGRFLQLPVMGLQAVSKLTIAGNVLAQTAYQWTREGLIKLNGGVFPSSWRSVDVEFSSGYPCAGALGAVLVQIASNALAAAPGVASERAGNVQITYNQTANGVSGGVALLDRDRLLLAPYRICEV